MAASVETVTVLVIEDNNDDATWDSWFERDFQHGAGRGTRRLVRYGDVCKTARAGFQKLLESLNDQLIPDVVVIDEMLETGGIYTRLEPLGLKSVLRPLRDECRRRGMSSLPTKCVLWSQRYTPGLAHAFVESGGTNAFGREVPSHTLIEKLWSVYDGGVAWQHDDWTPPKLELSVDQLLMLPYLEADLATHEIAARMVGAGELAKPPGEAQDWVNEKRRQIRDKANKILADEGQPLFRGSGHSSSLARFAIDHGNIWIPLEYRE